VRLSLSSAAAIISAPPTKVGGLIVTHRMNSTADTLRGNVLKHVLTYLIYQAMNSFIGIAA
jgi:hypothetical protein